MTRTLQALTVLAALAIAGAAAADVIVTDPLGHEFAIAPGGLVVIDNLVGNIHVSTHNSAKVSVNADRVIRAVDGSAVGEARQAVQRVAEGNDRMKILRTIHPGANPRWQAQVNYTVVLPRNVSLKIQSQQTGGIRVTDVSGEISVKNVMGPVLIESPGRALAVENINGDITVVAPRGIGGNTHLVSINGSIALRVPANSNFTWDVDTVAGEAKTNLRLRDGRYVSPTRFRGSVNNPGNTTVTMQSFAGNVFLLTPGSTGTDARALRTVAQKFTQPSPGIGPALPAAPNRGGVQLPLVQQKFYQYSTSIGDVKIDEIRGAAKIYTGAGEINLGSVFGYCDVFSRGGPLNLGEIMGPLTARTEGGNISIQRAREGGTIITGGGTIQVQYLGGPTQLSSGGGDIIVRRALGPVKAETRSGDVTITLDQKLKGDRVTAKTAKGNILLTVPAGFGADIDATVLTSDPAANNIRSDIPGLSLQREQVGAQTRIRATGKINGGGERVELQAQDGGIHLAVDAPRVSPMVPQQ
ncbi:MAG TPA: DUF4097 family beta strand repeat-containing protein [Thermoanaerobaculia bacterium]|nr:DUF4097 family beta strand repeat-containing protein [Thermoanaerobaculia bacterium]